MVFVIVGALVVALVVTRSGGKVSAIVMAKSVPVGHVITRDDLTTAQIATDTIPSFAGGHMSEVEGKIAAVGLVKGQLLNKDMISTGVAAPPDSAQVGVSVKPGQLPAGGVAPGDTVMVVVLPPSSSAASTGTAAPTVLAAAAPVIGSVDLQAGIGSVVTVQVPKSQAAQLAAASSSGQVALVKVTGQ
jgi:Flp pilus assembly protein CpaB